MWGSRPRVAARRRATAPAAVTTSPMRQPPSTHDVLGNRDRLSTRRDHRAMSDSVPRPAYMGTNEAAVYLGLRPQTLRRWRVQGGGPAYLRLGDGPSARCVYRADALEAWIAAHTVMSTAEAFARGGEEHP